MKVFFFCSPLGPPEKAGFEHQSIVLAEGLIDLGIQVFCNTNLWQQSDDKSDFLITASPDISIYKDCDIVIFSSILLGYHGFSMLPVDLFTKKRKYKLCFIDCADGLETPGMRRDIYENVDFILKSHYAKFQKYPANLVPWQFGISKRMLAMASPMPFDHREKTILVNFRVDHGLRGVVKKEVLPLVRSKFALDDTTDAFDGVNNNSYLDLLYWKQTGRRHYKSFYDRLSKSMSCACFGGELQSDFTDANKYLLRKVYYKLNGRFPIFNYKIYQFDSWRLWESLVSGSCSFHIDFEQYGYVLPVKPINNKHYVGVDLLKLDKFKRMMKNEYSYFEDIAYAGREWVTKYYSPKIVADRFMNLCR